MWQCAGVGCKIGRPSAASRTFSPKGKLMKLSFHARLPVLLLAGLCATQLPARAGEAEDCAGQIVDNTEPPCTAIIDDAPSPADDRLKALVSRSRLFIARAKVDLALADAEAALLLNPKSVPALLSRGYARQRKGDADGALADFNQAIELEPNNAVAYFTRANLRTAQRNFTDAMTDLNQAITLRPDYSQASVSR